MRFHLMFSLPAFIFAYVASAQSTASSSASTGEVITAVHPEVAFLQTLQAAQISSMSCLITLVNMTHQDIGDCLDLPTLSKLVVRPNDTNNFATQLDGYLTGVCGMGCTDYAIAEAKQQLADTCATSQETDLVRVLSAVLDGYSKSYKTLACSVYFNGTAAACLPSTMNDTEAADNQHFFTDLITGTNLDQYVDTVFKTAKCTGCTHELYKAAVYMIPSIRSNGITWAFGTHLQNECGDAAGVEWSNVQDQQIPDALQVQQSTGTSQSGACRKKSLQNGLLAGVLLGAVVFELAMR